MLGVGATAGVAKKPGLGRWLGSRSDLAAPVRCRSLLPQRRRAEEVRSTCGFRSAFFRPFFSVRAVALARRLPRAIQSSRRSSPRSSLRRMWFQARTASVTSSTNWRSPTSPAGMFGSKSSRSSIPTMERCSRCSARTNSRHASRRVRAAAMRRANWPLTNSRSSSSTSRLPRARRSPLASCTKSPRISP